mmetsp:Transcript_33512/g.96814  ORF Transcript_33512/g.96814 Transcript_33512/m.96814 type:complete len:206 (-) Transcript_33512:506-1123(-)
MTFAVVHHESLAALCEPQLHRPAPELVAAHRRQTHEWHAQVPPYARGDGLEGRLHVGVHADHLQGLLRHRRALVYQVCVDLSFEGVDLFGLGGGDALHGAEALLRLAQLRLLLRQQPVECADLFLYGSELRRQRSVLGLQPAHILRHTLAMPGRLHHIRRHSVHLCLERLLLPVEPLPHLSQLAEHPGPLPLPPAEKGVLQLDDA